MKKLKLYLYFTVLIFVGASCSPMKNSQFEEYLSLKYEAAECSQTINYTSTVALTGTAKFFKRGVNLVTEFESGTSNLKLKNMTQGDPLVNALPIQFAEVGVFTTDNQLVQCGKTDATGNLKAIDGVSDLLIPATAGSFSVRVYARMNHELTKSSVNVAIKIDKYTNEVYFISGLVSANGVDGANVDLLAYARQTDSSSVDGGAFNILNSIYTSYKYIDDNTSNAVDTSCLSSRLNAYWKLGFNPAQYAYPDQDPTLLPTATFYDQDEKSLFISGGKLGNFSFESAAHFDDYVIIHELGHHIENVCGSLFSPGGQHQIITRIDPRLAWAEAWANYFAAQVMYSSINSINPEFTVKMTSAGITETQWTYLFASEGFSDSVQNIGNGSGFMFDLKKPGNNPDSWQMGPYMGQAFDKVNSTLYPGEGHFREGAITRGLFKLSNTCGGSCIAATPIDFESMWKSMDKTTGIGQSGFAFKSSSDFIENLKNQITWNVAKQETANSEALNLFSDGAYSSMGIHKWIPYGTYLTNLSSGACAAGVFHIEPRSDEPVLTGTNSDQRYSNHFYTIDFSVLSELDEISVSFSWVAGTNTEFDILLFEEGYEFNGDYTCPSYSSDGFSCAVSYQASRGTNTTVVKSDRRSGTALTKTIRGLQQLDTSKRYLLNIRAYTANKSISASTEYAYEIKNQNGDFICP